MILISGRVRLETGGKKIKIVKKCDWFGGQAIAGVRVGYDAITEEDSILVSISPYEMGIFKKIHPELCDLITITLAGYV